MDEKRKGEIAIEIVKHQFKEKGIFLGSGVKRDLGNIAKETGIGKEELKEFFKNIFSEMVEEFSSENQDEKK